MAVRSAARFAVWSAVSVCGPNCFIDMLILQLPHMQHWEAVSAALSEQPECVLMLCCVICLFRSGQGRLMCMVSCCQAPT
jgi:hypothetical protein